MENLHSRDVNQQVLDLLIKNVVWFYDEFLMVLNEFKCKNFRINPKWMKIYENKLVKNN